MRFAARKRPLAVLEVAARARELVAASGGSGGSAGAGGASGCGAGATARGGLPLSGGGAERRAEAIATACGTPEAIAAEMVGSLAPPVPITLAHPSGQLVVRLESGPVARVQRTARRILEGHVFARRSHVPHLVLAA